ncbi:hypothetical protein NDA15_007322 [Ustilago hordei]|nr:hypothetical protein NDA15_007322 [Ustilago hordei]
MVKPIERFKKFELPEEAQQAFHKLIQAFTSAGVLQHFDYHLPTRLETDASEFAIAGVLKQEHEGRWHPVAFYSRKMSSAEKNYEIHDKELLAVVACLTQWRHMLAGLPNQLVILTDHEALKYFKSQRRITGRQARWAILLADFDFILQYRPGDKGGEPDALTRRTDMQPAGEEQDHNVRQLLPPRVFKETADHDSTLVAPMLSMESITSKGLKDLVKIFQPLDQELQEIHRKKPFELKDDLWYSGGRLVIPKVVMPGRTNNRHSRSAKEVDGQSLSVEHLRFMVMTQCHDGITAGHVGRDATIKAAQRHYWWPNMTAWIADYVASCPVCARYKAPRHRPYGLLQPLATPDRPWGSISLDFIEGLPPSKKYDSKTYDSILVIVDRLTKFAILAPTHKTVTAKQTAVLLYGHMVRLFGYPDHMVSDRGRQFISGAWKAFAEQMGVKHSLSTAYHPQTDGQTERVNQVIEQYLRMYCNYEQNDWANLLDTAAFVYNNTVHNSIGVSPFFACYGWNPKAHPDIPQRLGVNDPGRFEYLMDGKERCKYLQEQIREAQRRSVNQYNRKHKDIEFKPTIPSLPDEDLDFEVEALIDKRSHNGTTEYKVLWRGYSEEAASWEPVENLNCPDLIQEYEVSEGGRDQAQGAGTATRRTKLKEQAQPRRGPSSRSMQMVTTQGLERQEPKELSLIKGGGAVSKESTPGHEEEEQCRRISFINLDEQDDINYEKYASPTGPRYVKSRVDPYNKSRTEHYTLDQEEDSSIMAELNRSKPITTPFPKFNPQDVEIFILEAEAWFKFNQVYEQSRMINHMGAQLEGTAQEWWTSKLHIDRAREGRLFNDWHYFTERLSEQFNPHNARMEAYNKLLALRLTSDAPGAATHHVEQFRDLEGQVNLDDNELVIDLFRSSLTRSIQEKFERNPTWEEMGVVSRG